MQSKNSLSNQPAPKRSFIEEARRTQIVEATTGVLAEYGYTNTSFVRIGKQAGISPSLISYHFKDKDELTREVLATITRKRLSHIEQALSGATAAAEKLRTILEADLAYMGTRPQQFQATIEILFNHRSVKGVMDFLGETDTLQHMVRDVLISGQESGEFGAFDAISLALIIDAARDSFLAQLSHHPDYDLEAFTRTLVELALSAATKGKS